MVATLFLAGLAQPGRADAAQSPEYSVSVVGAGLGASRNQVTIFTRFDDPGGPSFWVLERRRHDTQPGGRAIADHQWADGRRCPALDRVVAGIGLLPPVRFQPPANTAVLAPPLDTDGVTLRGRAQPGEAQAIGLRVTAFTGPLVAWWSRAQELVEPCWSPTPPTVSGDPVTIRLPTEESMRTWR